MNKEWLWWLGEFGLAAVVAIVAGFVTKDVPISILYGLFVGTVFFVLRQNSRVASQFHREVSELEDKALNLPIAFSHKEDVDPYLKKLARSARDDALRLAKEAANGEVVLHLPQLMHIMQDFWKLPRPGDKVFAMNYGVGIGTPGFEILRQIIFEVAEKGVDITRVYIESTTATPEEKKRLREEMERQKGRIKVRFVKEAKLPQEARGHNMATILDRYAGYSSWSKTVGSGIRQVATEVRIYTRRDELEKAKELAETIMRLSEEYK